MKKIHSLFLMLCLTLFCCTGINGQVMIYLELLQDCDPAEVNLFNNSDITITGTPLWQWDVNGEYTIDTFELVGRAWEPGDYDITLSLYDDLGFQGSDSVTFQVYANPGIIMVTDNGEACPGEPMTFWVDENAMAYSIEWDFGDVSVPEDDIYSDWVTHT